MKFFSIDHIFQFTWDQVVTAYWQRYPNPKSKHVLTEDVYERKVVGDKLISKRLITKTNPVPRFARRFLKESNPRALIIEESVVDMNTKQFTTYTRNITMQDLCPIDEKCVYSPNLDNIQQTVCDRKECISYQYRFANDFINTRIANIMKKNSTNAVHGFEYIMTKLYIGEVPEFTKESMKERAKEYAKTKAEKVKTKAENIKSKVPIPQKTATPSDV